MNPRGSLIGLAASIAVIACLAAGSIAAGANAGRGHPVAAASKKCKRKHRHKRRRCKHRKHRTVAAPASIAITPTSQDFGVIAVGGTRRAFTVSNVGGSASGVPAATISGPDAASFSIAGNTCTAALLPAATCQIDVHLAFVGPVGPHSGTLTVTAAPGGTASAAMTGDVEI
jgi:hypothetical protein